MSNDTCELEIDGLDKVVGGTGSLSDVAAYVKGYVQALGTVPEPPAQPDICDGEGILCRFGF